MLETWIGTYGVERGIGFDERGVKFAAINCGGDGGQDTVCIAQSLISNRKVPGVLELRDQLSSFGEPARADVSHRKHTGGSECLHQFDGLFRLPSFLEHISQRTVGVEV